MPAYYKLGLKYSVRFFDLQMPDSYLLKIQNKSYDFELGKRY